MKYLCLIVLDETKYASFSGSDLQVLDDATIEYGEMLRSGGHLLAASALEATRSATTVRVQNGKAIVTHGPYAQTYEQVGGFLLIEARDLNEAIQLASIMPCAYLGGIEIRPVRELVLSTDPERRI